MPESLRAISEVQWIAYKCSRKSAKLVYHEFTDQITKLEQLSKSHVPTAASAPKPKQRRKLKRATVSPTSGGRGKKSRSEQSLPSATSTLSEGENSLMEETDFSDDCLERETS
ncbi:hypothetical protein TNCT_22921 [Trichonephila clavata]|uniref:Uncharacterized protein n=1 Tax=Trichonephila clavata TaxID=2740835 RepID=A0A8X6HNC0_TRICU|nr:hypothetical protein TNCT_22921 [Trichonephila clavata]